MDRVHDYVGCTCVMNSYGNTNFCDNCITLINVDLLTLKKNSHCIADRVLNYIQFINKKIMLRSGRKDDGNTLALAIDIYQSLRSDLFFNGMNPINLAASIYYIASQVKFYTFPQKKIAAIVHITTPSMTSTIRKIAVRYKIELGYNMYFDIVDKLSTKKRISA